ncbi:pre-tape measure chaperone [Citromicrobium phage vB_CbaS-RXM]|nr:pre-tape measure chaperone [Citromicrobium phage vB_CbaS-RXM]
MNIYEAFETKELEEDGKWFDLGPDSGIKLLYMGCEKARRKHENLMRPYAQRQKLGLELSDDESTAVNSKFLSECLVLDWKGIKGKDKEDIPYSPEAVAALCKALPRFTAIILRIAMDETNFEKELVETETGN